MEAFDIAIPEAMCDRLEASRLRAEALSEDLSGREVFTLGCVELQMIALRGKGLRWRLENDDIAIRIRPVKMGYPVSVRYSAAGLWEHGYAKLHQKTERAVRALGCPRGNDWQRLSEVHRAFDFHAPDFTPEMRPGLMEQVIAHSEVKKAGMCGRDFDADEIWGKAGRLETLTIGKGAPLEIQVYDKGREIEEASGKTWMLDLWEQSGAWRRKKAACDENCSMHRKGHCPNVRKNHCRETRQEHCWRIEVRFRSDFLRDRSILTMADFAEVQAALLAEALLTRRLCMPSDDSNRARWPLHWLWCAALHHSGEAEQALPLGRRLTEARDVIGERLVKGLAGTLRAAVVLRCGHWNQAVAALLLPRLIAVAEADSNHNDKVALARERYRYLDEAK